MILKFSNKILNRHNVIVKKSKHSDSKYFSFLVL
jgi:hypothetical protein